MAKAFAKQFYSSKAWQSCRNEYVKSVHHLCENCLRQGIYRPGEIVHHKIHIDPLNIEKPEVTLNFDNLELLCRECHSETHKTTLEEIIKKAQVEKAIKDRFFIATDGTVYAKMD